MTSGRTIKYKSLYQDTKEKSFSHCVLQINQQLSSFRFRQVKRSGKNINSPTLLNLQKHGFPGGPVFWWSPWALTLLPCFMLQQSPQGNRQRNGEKEKIPPAARPTAALGTPPTARAARRRHRPPT